MEYERKELLTAQSERVKGIDLHPTESWILTTLYTGFVNIWSYESKTLIKTFELTDVPVRAGRFIARQNWIVCGSDDFQIRVYNYNTSEKITSFEAHPDYIRAIAVHPTQPFILTASDDMTIKRWDWNEGWKNSVTYAGHGHYVMSLAINPKDSNIFASGCLDRTVKIWSIGQKDYYSQIVAHDPKGVNHVSYYPHGDNPYLLTTSDDKTVKIWDYSSKGEVNSLPRNEGDPIGHTSNVSFACYHPELPLIISGSEDGTMKMWNSITYALEETIQYNLERAWCVSYRAGSNIIAAGFDKGAVVLKIGSDDPAVSMQQQGWFAWYHNHDLHISRLLSKGEEADGQPAALQSSKSEDFSDFFPKAISHSPRGQYFAISGTDEYEIHKTREGDMVARGSGSNFVWSPNTKTNSFAVIENNKDSPRGRDEIVYLVKIKENQMTEVTTSARKSQIQPSEKEIQFKNEKVLGLSAGALLGVRTDTDLYFFEWDTAREVTKAGFEEIPKLVYWSDSGALVALAFENEVKIMRFHEGPLSEEEEIPEKVKSGLWVGDCFVFTNDANHLRYLVGNNSYMIAPFDKPMYLLGYMANKEKVYLTDKDVQVTTFSLSLKNIEYQTLVVRREDAAADAVLEEITSVEQRNKIARFLEDQGMKEKALEVTQDQQHRFDLALDLEELDIAVGIARERNYEPSWKTVGDAALKKANFPLAEECFANARDLGSLLLLYTAIGNHKGLKEIATQSEEQAAHNIAFTCLWSVGDVDGCIDLLIRANRVAEAVLFSKTYKPSRCREIVLQWKGTLEKSGKTKVSRALAVPPDPTGGEDDGNTTFPSWDEYLEAEKKSEQPSFQQSMTQPPLEANGEDDISKSEDQTNGDAADDDSTA